MSATQTLVDESQTASEAIPADQTQGEEAASVAAGSINHLDVEEELSFYAAYHSNKMNQCIHFMCIPAILWSWLIIIGHVTLPGAKYINFGPGLSFEPSLGLAWIIAYLTYYIILDRAGGISYLPIGTIMYLTATFLVHTPLVKVPFMDPTTPMNLALKVNVLAWLAQFVGHAFFERRAPAFTENPVQALVLAPFFVHLEALFAFFDYKPEMHRKIRARAGLRIRQMIREKAAAAN